MKTPPVLLMMLAAGAALLGPARGADDAWPAITRDNKPWIRWWWPGSAVDAAGLTQQLEQFDAAGLGGVEITPIYGAKGYESRYIEFLSPQWMTQLEFTGREAKRLGLGVDMATGTGWPFGGPWLTPADGSSTLVLQDGRLTGKPTGMKVKRAAPGDEGLVVDPFSPDALEHYLAPFSRAFASFPRELIRSQFHDSFEYYGASWTPDLPAVFQQMHGYDVQTYAAELMGAKDADPDLLARVRSDYRATLAQLHLAYLQTWVKWSHERGFLVRNQSHGAPANLLDLYGTVDIPETETFGSTPFPIPGLRRTADEVRRGLDLPNPLVMRMASSAAHVMGHPYASSETCTWLRDHWKETLSDAKPEIDRLFANGINHIIYHGSAYSPPDVPWPGWLFYAATQFNPRNTWWDYFGALNAYVARVQSILQGGQPDNDILVYWPVFDIWDGGEPLIIQLGVHDAKWLYEQPFGRLGHDLMRLGYSFDGLSDAQLRQTRVEGKAIVTSGGHHYRVLVVPATRRMPVATLQHLAQLSREGGTVIFQQLPEDVPGEGRLDARRAEFKAALAPIAAHGIVEADVPTALATRFVPRETIADAGIDFIRRATDTGHDYFFANLTGARFDGWVTLSVAVQAATVLDPLTGAAGRAALRPGAEGKAQVYLQLASGESLIVRTSTAARKDDRALWPYRRPGDKSFELAGKWSVTFIKGGPELPPPFETLELKSWTELGGPEAQRFGGTAAYHLEFEAPAAAADDWLLDLGDVRESARLRINGRAVTTAWSLPFTVRVGDYLKPGHNVIELDVTNLAANRIRDMDQRKVPWKIMREINFVDINYRPFDASGWSLMPSGLLGPVRLIPLKAFNPIDEPPPETRRRPPPAAPAKP